MTDHINRRTVARAALVIAAAVFTASLARTSPVVAAAETTLVTETSSATGAWSLAFVTSSAGAVAETAIGKLSLGDGGACAIDIRASFNGYVHDHVRPATACTWTPAPSPALDGTVTATGLTDGPVFIGFVVADGGRRLLLQLDAAPLPGATGAGDAGTTSGFLGTGEAFRV